MPLVESSQTVSDSDESAQLVAILNTPVLPENQSGQPKKRKGRTSVSKSSRNELVSEPLSACNVNNL